jgi:hypothetical protein
LPDTLARCYTPHCTPGPSPYIYKRKVHGPRTKKVVAREDGLTDRLSLSPSRTLVTPYCKRIRPGRRITRSRGFPPCVPSRADPSRLGHAATIYSSVQGPPRVETPTGTHHHTRLLKQKSKCMCLRRELKAGRHKSYPDDGGWSLLSVLLCVTFSDKMTP